MADKSNDNSGITEVGFLDLILVLSENARLLVYGPVLAGLAAFGLSFLIPLTFTATTRIVPPQQQGTASVVASQLGSLAGMAGPGGLNIRNPVDMYVSLVKSRTVADRIIDRFKLTEIYKQEQRYIARKILADSTRVMAGKDGLITIDVDARDAELAARLANGYVEELTRLSGELAITEAQQRRMFFDKQLKEAQSNLIKAEVALSESGAGENLMKTAPQVVVERMSRLKAQVTAQEIKLATMRASLTEANPEYRVVQRELESTRAQLAQAEREVPAKGGRPSEYLTRFRDFKYYETLFDLLAKQYEIARLDEAREGAVVQIVDRAIPPEFRSKPVRRAIAGGAFLITALFLLLVVLVRHALKATRTDSNSSNKLAGIGAGLKKLVRG